VGVNDCNGIGGYEISCFGMDGFNQSKQTNKQTNKQTINHRYTIYGIEKKQSQQNTQKQWDCFHGFFQRDFMGFFYGIKKQLQNGGFKWDFTINNRDLILG